MKTNVRQTSIEAYEDLVKAGKDGLIRARILRVVIENGGPLTRLQISKLTGHTINATVSQVNAMIKDKVIEEDGRVDCPLTGRSVMAIYPVTAASIDESERQGMLF